MAFPSISAAAAGGWAFPPAFDRLNKTVCISTGTTNIAENLRILFSTDPGERFLLPAYGTPLSKYLFGALDTTTENEMKRDLHRAISQWEPRIELLSVELQRSPVSAQTIEIVLTYRERVGGMESTFHIPLNLDASST